MDQNHLLRMRLQLGDSSSKENETSFNFRQQNKQLNVYESSTKLENTDGMDLGVCPFPRGPIVEQLDGTRIGCFSFSDSH